PTPLFFSGRVERRRGRDTARPFLGGTTVSTTATSADNTSNKAAVAPPGTTSGPDPRRWLALGVIAVTQLLIVLDATIVNIALPTAQKALHISDADRQWMVTAYTLAFGGLLLLGGRIA